jgi:hypothetical protein
MTLDWNTTKVKYFSENPDKLWVTYYEGTPQQYDDVNAETKTLIFATMAIGIGNIKMNNASDFYARFKIMEKYDKISLYSRFVYDENGDSELEYTYLTPDVVVKHIGLSTNVSHVSKKDWITRYVKNSSNSRYIEDKPNIKDLTKLYSTLQEEFEGSFYANV